jgi:hypothetical protein
LPLAKYKAFISKYPAQIFAKPAKNCLTFLVFSSNFTRFLNRHRSLRCLPDQEALTTKAPGILPFLPNAFAVPVCCINEFAEVDG